MGQTVWMPLRQIIKSVCQNWSNNEKTHDIIFYLKTHTADFLHPAIQFGIFLQVRLQQPSL